MGFSGASVGSIHATLELDRAPFTRALEEARRQVKVFQDERHRVEIRASLSGLDKARADLEKLRGKHLALKVDLSGLNKAKAQLAEFTAKTHVAHIKATVDSRAVDKLRAQIAALHDKTVKVTVDSSSLGKVTRDARAASGALSGMHAPSLKASAIIGGLALAPQFLGSLGAATAGAGALGVAGAGAGLSFGVLGKAVQSAITTQGNYYKNVQAVQTAQKQLTTAQNQGAVSALAVQKAQQALTTATVSGNAQKIASAQQHLAIVQSSTQSQLQGNAQLIAAARQHLAIVKQNAEQQNQLAQKVRDSFANLQDGIRKALGPAVQQVLHGLLSGMSAVSGALGGLSAPFLKLGTAIHTALASPAVQSGIRSLIDGFGRMTAATAPLVGPIMTGVINLGKVFLNIARAAMPALVGEVRLVAGWLGKVVAHTSNTAKLRGEIQHLVTQFNGWVKAALNLGKALWPLFKSVGGFLPVLNVVISITGAFVKLLVSLGPVGRLLAGGLGLVLLSTRFSSLKKVMDLLGFEKLKGKMLDLAKVGIGKLSAAVLDLGKRAIGGLVATVLPALGTALAAAGKAVLGMAASFGKALIAASPYLIGLALVAGAVLLVIKFHKQIGKAIEAAWKFIKHVVETVVKAVWTVIKDIFIATPLGAIIHFHKQITHAVEKAWNFIKGIVTGAVKAVLGVVTGAWHAVEKATSAAWKAVTGAPKKKRLGMRSSTLSRMGSKL